MLASCDRYLFCNLQLSIDNRLLTALILLSNYLLVKVCTQEVLTVLSPLARFAAASGS